MATRIMITPELDEAKLQQQLDNIEKRKEKITVDIDSKNINGATQDIKKLNSAVSNSNSVFGKLKNTISNTFSSGKIAMTSYIMVLNEIRKAARDAKDTIKELDQAVTDLSVATNMSRESVSGLIKDYNAYGKELASTTKDITSAADDYLRAGKSMSEARALIKDSIMLSKLGQLESGASTEDLLATMNGYEMSIEEVGKALDAMVAIDMEAATSAGDIATALKYSASSADVAGLSFNKLAAMIATVQDKTQQSAETIGTFMNTLLSRYRNVKIGQFVSDDGEDLSEMETILDSLDIKLRDSSQEFRDFEIVIEDVASKWDSFSSVQQAAIAKAFSGTRQQNRFYALMEGYSKTLELTEVAANSAGTALDKFNNSYMESLEAKQNTLQNAFESMILNSDLSEVYAGILDAAAALLDFINKTNSLKGVMSGLAVSGGIKAFLTIKTGINEAYIALNKFQNALNISKSSSIATQDFEKLLLLANGLSASQMKLVLSTNNLTVAQKQQLLMASGLSAEKAALQLETWGMTAANTGLTAATTTLGNAFKGLWATLVANPLILVTAAVSATVMAWQSYNQKLEETRQATEESANAYKEATSSIEDYTSRYQELHKALLESKGDEEETYNVKKQLLDLQTELNDKFGDEYGTLNLVTDAYKDQTEAISELNKAKAETFLNENRKGIEDASKEMNKERTYNLSYTGVSDGTDEGAVLKEIAEKYADEGVRINEDKDTGTYNIILEADAQSAYETINAFENDLRNKAKEIGDEHIFDDVFEISSAELNNAKEVIDKYSDIYKQALMAELVADDNKSNTYNEALKAVEEYNEAVLKSEDPYNDENVLEAKANLDKIRESIQGNNEEWGKYSAITDDVFTQADTRVLDFNEKLKNDSGLQKLANDMKGLSDLDLKALDENVGDNESFDKLKASAAAYNVNVDELIDTLLRLGIVQGEIQNLPEDQASIDSARKKLLNESNDESANEWINSISSSQASIVNSPEFQESLDKQKEAITKKNAETLSDIENQYSEARQTIADEYQKISELGLDDYAEDIKSGAIQSQFGNVDMDKRAIIEWSDELKQTYADALASWDYEPEIGSIDSVLGKSDRFGEDLNGIGWEIAFTPILPDGTLINKDTVYEYINTILEEAYSNDGKLTEDELRYIDLQGRQIGDTFVKGIFAGIDDSQNYENNGNWADTAGRMMQFAGSTSTLQSTANTINTEIVPEIDEAKEAAEKAALSAENYSKALEEAQNKIGDASFAKIWAEAVSSEEEGVSDLTNDLLELAEKGRLTEEAFNKLDSNKHFESLGISAEVAVRKINKLVDESKQLSSMSDQISKMSEALAAKKENGFVDANTLSGFDAEVRGLDSWDEFQNVLGSTTSSYKECRQAANNLATEWVNSNNFLSQLTEENKEYYETQLREMGVANAQEIVYDALNKKTEELALEKQFLAQTGIDVANATEQDIQEYIAETGASAECAQSLMVLALKKAAVNGVLLDTSADISNLLSLAKAAGIATDNLSALAYAKSGLALAEEQGNEPMVSYYNDKIKELGKKAEEDIFNFEQVEVDFGKIGGGKSSAGSAGKEAADEYLEAFEKELKDLDELKDAGLITEKQYLDRLRVLYNKYFKDKAKYLKQYAKYEKQYLNGRHTCHLLQ